MAPGYPEGRVVFRRVLPQTAAVRLRMPPITVLFLTAAAAAAAMFLHALDTNPQPDTQIITYAYRFLESVRGGALPEFLLEPRKYPLLSSYLLLPPSLVALLALLTTAAGGDTAALRDLAVLGHPLLYGTARALVLAAGGGAMWMLGGVSRRLQPDVPAYVAPALLTSSVLFLVFSTAVRPHLPVTAWTIAAAWGSLRLADEGVRKRRSSLLIAFGAATAAFCTLQNGLLAFILPVWGYATVNGALRPGRVLHGRLWAWLLLSGGASVLIGYPFLLAPLLGRRVQVGFDLGHDYMEGAPKWTLAGFRSLLQLLRGSELLLVALAVLGTVSARGRRLRGQFGRWAGLLAFAAVFATVFGAYGGSAIRFFLPLLPVLALLAGAGYAVAPRWVQWGTVALTALVHLQVLRLALVPDSFAQTRAFLQERTRGVIASEVPFYLLGIPPIAQGTGEPLTEKERLAARLQGGLPGARVFLSLSAWEQADVAVARHDDPFRPGPGWQACFETASLPWSYDGLLWAEADWSLAAVFRAPALGPALTVYCREPDPARAAES